MPIPKNNFPSTINALVNAGADVNAQYNYGWTPLVFAAKSGSPDDAVDALEKAGATILLLLTLCRIGTTKEDTSATRTAPALWRRSKNKPEV